MQRTTSPVDEIKQRLDISEVLSEYVKLKPAGANRFKVLCPFHTEKTPSLMVSKDKQVWHCFGCGRGGDMFSFVQEIEGIDFPEVLRLLAKKAHVELRAFDPELQTQRTRLLDIVKLSSAFYRKVLTDAAGASRARAYLRERAVSDETAEDFQLGYSPTGWDALFSFLTKKGFREQDIFDAGLTVKREKGTGYYDRFRGRLMFPIRDVNGMVVGFGGRLLEQAEGDVAAGAKYINTPETLVYSKSSVLYGLDRAKRAIKQADLAVLVEGYMDCIASHQAGVANTVAVSGTALTERQVKLLKRYTNNLALAFDADLAGDDAARRGIDQAINADMRVRVITLTSAKDPDELIKRDPGQWRNAVARAERIVDYAFNRAFADADVRDVDVKRHIAQRLLPVIARLPDPIEQSHYLQLLGEKLSIDEVSLRDSLKRITQTFSSSRRKAAPEDVQPTVPEGISRGGLVAERILSLTIFAQPIFFAELSEKLDPDTLHDGELKALYRQAILYYNQTQHFDGEHLHKHIANELPALKERIAKLVLLVDDELSHMTEKEVRREIDEGVRYLRRERIAAELRHIEEELRRAEAANSGATIDALLQRMNELTDQLHALDV